MIDTMQIRKAYQDDAQLLASIISRANNDVAVRFNITRQNCSKHPSFCTPDWIENELQRGQRYFLWQDNEKHLGCVAYEEADQSLAYLNRLSVLPEHRKQGIGEELVNHIIKLAREEKKRTISIGIIEEHDQLRNWYAKLGFASGEVKQFEHLPFTVLYMTYQL